MQVPIPRNKADKNHPYVNSYTKSIFIYLKKNVMPLLKKKSTENIG